MGAFNPSPEKLAELTQQYNATASQQLGEQALATGSFQGSGAWYQMIPGLGGLIYLIIRLIVKSRSGGLPTNFILAVTATKVHAFKYRPRGYTINLGKEVAVWNRRDLKLVSRVDGTVNTQLVPEATDEGQPKTLKIQATMLNKNPMAAGVIDLLAAGPAAA